MPERYSSVNQYHTPTQAPVPPLTFRSTSSSTSVVTRMTEPLGIFCCQVGFRDRGHLNVPCCPVEVEVMWL